MTTEIYGLVLKMIVNCINGFYKFIPESSGEIHIWENYNEMSLTPVDDFFTFPELAEMPNYSFIGGSFQGIALTENYAGEKSEVLRRNNIVFDYSNKMFMRKELVFDQFNYDAALYPNTPILPQAGSINGLKRLMGFHGFWNYKFNIYKFLRFEYESILG